MTFLTLLAEQVGSFFSSKIVTIRYGFGLARCPVVPNCGQTHIYGVILPIWYNDDVDCRDGRYRDGDRKFFCEDGNGDGDEIMGIGWDGENPQGRGGDEKNFSGMG